MKIGIIITTISLFFILAQSAILPISSGGTNAAAMLTNGKVAYSTIGSIIEAQPLKSADGKSLTVGETYATISPIAPVKFNLLGMNNNNTGSPGISTYTSNDNYPLIQTLPYAHNDVSINFDMYWDLAGAWRSSYSGSNFQIYKYLNRLSVNYASGNAQGNLVSASTAFSIENNGSVTFQKPIKLATSGGTASDLNYYSEGTYNATVYRYQLYGGTTKRVPLDFYNTSGSGHMANIYTMIRFVRVNNIVTAQIDPFTMYYYTYLYSTNNALAIDTSTIPSRFRPKYGLNAYYQYGVNSNYSVTQGPRNTAFMINGGVIWMGSTTIVGSIIASNTTTYSTACSCLVTNSEFFLKPDGGYTFLFANFTIGLGKTTVLTYEVDPSYA